MQKQVLLFLLSCGLIAACHNSPPATSPVTNGKSAAMGQSHRPNAAQVVLSPPGAAPVTVQVEVAQSPAEVQRGLMFRQELAPDAGMLFIFETCHHLTFWMKNTYLPLDMIFIRSDRSVLGVVENATPLTETAREIPGDSQYVLEVNAGFARAHQILPDTKVSFVNVPGF